MLKLNASYSKKVPVKGEQYSSQSYHASVEIEISDGLTPQQLQSRIHETFELVRQSVEVELKEPGTVNDTPRTTQRKPEPPASGKQIKFLSDLAIRRKMDIRALNGEASRLYGVADVSQLTRKQASELIDRLNSTERKVA